MRKDYGKHRHMDWRFLFVWLVQMSAAAVFFLTTFGAFISCGWGLLSHLGWIPDPEGVPILQTLKLQIHGHEIYHYIRMAVDWFKSLCTKNYSYCTILLLILFLILIEAWAILLNRLAAAHEIRRYNI